MELNKEVLDCMKALRRRLREEQDVDIRLSQPNAVGARLVEGSWVQAFLTIRNRASRHPWAGTHLRALQNFQAACWFVSDALSARSRRKKKQSAYQFKFCGTAGLQASRWPCRALRRCAAHLLGATLMV